MDSLLIVDSSCHFSTRWPYHSKDHVIEFTGEDYGWEPSYELVLLIQKGGWYVDRLLIPPAFAYHPLSGIHQIPIAIPNNGWDVDSLAIDGKWSCTNS